VPTEVAIDEPPGSPQDLHDVGVKGGMVATHPLAIEAGRVRRGAGLPRRVRAARPRLDVRSPLRILAPPAFRLHLAQQQLASHAARLAAYQRNEHSGRRPRRPRGQRTVEHWRGEAVQLGLLYEHAAVEFWTGVLANARGQSD
jgi:hypothetical protein